MPLNENEQRFAPEFERGCALRDRGQLEAAISVFARLTKQLQPQDTQLLAHSHMQLGNCFNGLGRKIEAESAFRSATEVAPRKELASLALFHSLLALDRRTDAHREMLRFLRLRGSEMYRELLEGDYGAELTGEDRELVRLARDLVAEHATN